MSGIMLYYAPVHKGLKQRSARYNAWRDEASAWHSVMNMFHAVLWKGQSEPLLGSLDTNAQAQCFVLSSLIRSTIFKMAAV